MIQRPQQFSQSGRRQRCRQADPGIAPAHGHLRVVIATLRRRDGDQAIGSPSTAHRKRRVPSPPSGRMIHQAGHLPQPGDFAAHLTLVSDTPY